MMRGFVINSGNPNILSGAEGLLTYELGGYYIKANYEGKDYNVYLKKDQDQNRWYVDFNERGPGMGTLNAMDLLDAISQDPRVQPTDEKTYCNILVEMWCRLLNIPLSFMEEREWLANVVYNTYTGGKQIKGLGSRTYKPLPGDIVVWNGGGEHGHMGIYMGEVNGEGRYYGYGSKLDRGAPLSGPTRVTGSQPVFIEVPYIPNAFYDYEYNDPPHWPFP